MRALSFIPSWFVNAAPQLSRKCFKLRATFHTFSKLARNHLMQSNNVWNISWYFLSEQDLDVRLFWMSTSTLRCLLQETLRPALRSRRAWPALEETAQPARGVIIHIHTLCQNLLQSVILSWSHNDRFSREGRREEILAEGKLPGS